MRAMQLETLFLSYGAFLICAVLAVRTEPGMVYAMLVLLALVLLLRRWTKDWVVRLPILFVAVCCWYLR